MTDRTKRVARASDAILARLANELEREVELGGKYAFGIRSRIALAVVKELQERRAAIAAVEQDAGSRLKRGPEQDGPTPEMIEAGFNVWLLDDGRTTGRDLVADIYKAMRAKAP